MDWIVRNISAEMEWTGTVGSGSGRDGTIPIREGSGTSMSRVERKAAARTGTRGESARDRLGGGREAAHREPRHRQTEIVRPEYT